jgi:hypothetical protein
MLHKIPTNRIALSNQQRKDTLVQAAVGNGLLNDPSYEFRGPQMRGMRLDHDRATGSKRRRGVSSRNGKGEREIAGAENRNRAKSDLAQTKIGTRERLAIWQGRIERSADPSALANYGSEELQLSHRPSAFAFNPASRQASLRAGSIYKPVS